MSTLVNGSDEIPPVPPLSYWDPDTPSPFASIRSQISPSSPTNPFLAPPEPSVKQDHRFRKAAPLLPASPLSIFDSPMSPMAVTFLRTPTPSPIKASFLLPASPGISPRWLFPRTPPPFPLRQRQASVYDAVKNMAERKGSMASMVRMRENMKLDFYQSLLLKRQREMDSRSGDRKNEGRNKWTIKTIWRRLVGGRDEREAEGESRTVLVGDRRKMPTFQSLVFRA
jgi:hypothetical protein